MNQTIPGTSRELLSMRKRGRERKRLDTPTTTDTQNRTNLNIYLYMHWEQYNAASSRLGPNGQVGATHPHTHTETTRTTWWSLCWKHAGFPRTEAAPSRRKNNVETTTTEEAATLTEPGRHSCSAPQLRSPKMKKKKKNKEIVREVSNPKQILN